VVRHDSDGAAILDFNFQRFTFDGGGLLQQGARGKVLGFHYASLV
jgi:hypothetical protein